MDFMLHINIPSPEKKISYQDKICITGSCFTEHIGGRLQQYKFDVLQNPNGILFDPLSVCGSLKSYIQNQQHQNGDLFYLNELWQSWQHHSVLSGVDKDQVLQRINHSLQEAHDFLKQSDWLIITLGSSYHYRLADTGTPVANCHRAPAQWFKKHLLDIDEIIREFRESINQLYRFNNQIKIVFTVSPVRHIRDGVVENNRSKARLIEAVHELVSSDERMYYFPAYELVIDVLRDYRFYDIDLVHPNYAATEFVFEKFAGHFLHSDTLELMKEIKKVMAAYHHKPFQSTTSAHQQFLQTYLKKIQQLKKEHPHIDFKKEILYFSDQSGYQPGLP